MLVFMFVRRDCGGGFDELATNMKSMPNLDSNAFSTKVVLATGVRAADDLISSEFHFD